MYSHAQSLYHSIGKEGGGGRVDRTKERIRQRTKLRIIEERRAASKSPLFSFSVLASSFCRYQNSIKCNAAYFFLMYFPFLNVHMHVRGELIAILSHCLHLKDVSERKPLLANLKSNNN
jgi:hypothetical protein